MATRTCSIDDCHNTPNSRGLCSKHYARFRRHGDPRICLNERGEAGDRFWRFVAKGDGCWTWTGFVNPRGYGRFQEGRGASWQAHRYSYILHKGPIPDGLLVMHICDNRKCVNPAHLMLGTAKDNTADMLAKGRGRWLHKHGEESNFAKLTESDVRAIRGSSERGVDLARRYGVSPTAICDIRKRRNWKHIE